MFHRYKHIFCIAILFVFSSLVSLNSQEKKSRFQYLTTDNGLTHNMIDCMLLDSKGFMWFGTWNGLNRFDGYNFTVYKGDSRNTGTLSGNFIYDIIEDNEGNIWIATENGLNVYLYQYDTFIHYNTSKESNASISSDRIQVVFYDKIGVLWAGTDKGLDKLTIGTNGQITDSYHYHESDDINGLTFNSVTSVFQDQKGNLWVGTSNGLNIIDGKTGSVVHLYADPSNPGSLSSNTINTIFQDRKGTIWVGTLNGLNRLDNATGKFSSYFHNPTDPGSLIHSTVMSIIEDLDGNLIVGTLGGLGIYNEKEGKFNNFTSFGNPNYCLNNEFVNCLLCTNDGNIWIGTERGGINKYNIYQNKFEFFETEINNKNSLSHNTVNSIYEDDKYIWIGTAGGGLNQYNKSTGYFTHHRYNPGVTTGLASDFVSAIFRDRYGNLWIGTWGGGLHLFDQYKTRKGKLIRYQNSLTDTNSLVNNFVACIIEDRFGDLWIGTLGGIDRYNHQQRRFEHFIAGFDGKMIDRVGCLLFDQNDNLWIGTQIGLFRAQPDQSGKIDCSNSDIKYFASQPSDPESICGNYIISMCCDMHGDIWFGTYGNGLNHLKKEFASDQKPRFINYTESDGMCNNIVFGILEDNSGNLWLSTDNGLSRFNIETREFKNYYTGDGLQSNQFYWSASYRNKDGKMYFGSMNGLNAFYPDSLLDHTVQQQTIITDFKIFNKSVSVGQKYYNQIILKESIINTDHLILSYRIKEFSFEFTSQNYLQPEKTLYAYKMQGFNDNWSYVDSKRRFVSYTNLRGGDYTFMVMSSQDAKWDSEPVMLHITIIPPIWENTWFIIIFSLLLLSVILLYITYRTYSLKKQKQKLERLVNERTTKIEEQKIELLAQANNLKESYLQLEKRQELIKGQKQQLEIQNTQILEQRDKLIDLNKKVQQVNQQQLNFFTYISHEFRSPLTLITTPLEQLIMDKKADTPTGNKLQLIYRNAQRLLHLINQLMEIRKVETGKIVLKTAWGDLVSFVNGISQSFMELASQKEIKFRVSSTATTVKLYFDRDIIENIIYNLLSNAFKYAPDHGEINMDIELVTADDLPENEIAVIDKHSSRHLGINSYVKICVSDSGPGIPADKIRDIFRRFYRLPSIHKVQGSGIGLYLTKEMVKAHKGLLYVNSIIGKGSSFSVFIPRNRDYLLPDEIISDHQIIKESEQTTPDYPLTEFTKYPEELHSTEVINKKNKLPVLLIVDDDPELISYLKDHLHNSYQVISTENGKEGFAKASRYSPDLIISDIMMPEMDGLEFCSLIKNDIHTSHIPVILLTARTEVEHFIEGFETGADDYISKPFNISLLEIKIRNLIENRKKLRQLYMQNLTPVPRELTTTRPDENFLRKTLSVIEQNITDPKFSVHKLAEELSVSRSLLHKKLTAIADVSANDFITTIRLKKSAILLMEGKMNVSEIAFSLGFNDPKYFSRCFKKQFGKPPKEYAGCYHRHFS
jgi:ligand-binding sensor domain-containing protein/signal transduction histidine kinase/DNA-binding response OmpR family regulator